MMEKILPVGGWDFGIPPTAMLRTIGGRLGPNDRRDLLSKRAAHSAMIDLLHGLELKPGDLPIHTAAVGATEAWGFNRNGDGFCEDTCRKQAHTFVGRPLKDWTDGGHNGARLYRHHDNQHPPRSYGYVKEAMYHPRMRRIELLLIGNATKEAAERNGGLVLPDSTLELLHSGKDLPGSMACKVAYDVCQICLNKAASRADYCTEESCIDPRDGFRGLGCRHNLTKLAGNGRQQGVENPNCVFFDWSEVFKPAERTAFGGIADYLTKAAAAGVGGAEMAEHVRRLWDRPELVADDVSSRVEVLRELASEERKVAAAAMPPCPPLTGSELSVLGPACSEMRAGGLRALADAGVMLDPVSWLRVSGADESQAESTGVKIAALLPGVFNRLLSQGDRDTLLREQAIPDGRSSERQRKLASVLTGRLGLRRMTTLGQLALGAASPPRPTIKLASGLADAVEPLALRYAAYQVNLLDGRPRDAAFPLTRRAALLHNHKG